MTSNPDEPRLRHSLSRLMQMDAPRRDAEFAQSPHPLRTFAVAASALVATFAVLAGGFVLLRHPVGGGPASKPRPAVLMGPTPTTMYTPAPSPAASSYLPAVGSPCVAADLTMRLGQQAGAGGSGVAYLIFTDRAAAPCVLRGTPVVTLLDSDGRALTVPDVVDTPGGMFPTLPNAGVGLIPLADQGTAPGPLPEGGVRGQASLPLQNAHDGCDSAVAAVAVDVGGGRLIVPLTLLGPPVTATGGNTCQITVVDVNPFQPAEFMK